MQSEILILGVAAYIVKYDYIYIYIYIYSRIVDFWFSSYG